MSDTSISLEDLYNEYNRILKAKKDNQLSDVHMSGALAYLELKAKDSGIIFIAPELNHTSSDFKPLDGVPPELYGEDSSSDIWDSSEIYEESSDIVTPQPEETSEETSEEDLDDNKKEETEETAVIRTDN